MDPIGFKAPLLEIIAGGNKQFCQFVFMLKCMNVATVCLCLINNEGMSLLCSMCLGYSSAVVITSCTGSEFASWIY